ncbi:outer membrane beta-barrel protein [Hansschlegelia zhihuaiae]|nr:outer membrane beta-barrel protein [Hansschlegelia zhihuaiae]
MSRRRAILQAVLVASTVLSAAGARAQDAPGDEPLRRLDANALAGGEGGLAGGDYGAQPTEQQPLAGGDYGIASRPESSAATIAPTILSDPLGAAPRGFRPVRLPSPRGTADDPYAPLGVEAGPFVLRPSLEAAGGYDDNPDRLPEGGKGSRFLRLRGEIDGRTDWSRHEVGIRASGQIRRYLDLPDPGFEPEVSAAATGRLDVTERTQINSELRASLAASRPGDPETPNSVKGDELTRSAGATLGVAQRFNRLSLRLDGLVDRYTVDDAKLTGGGTLDNSDRAYNAYEARLRASYEVSPRLEPFVEAGFVTRDYDRKFSNNAINDDNEIVEDRRRLGSDGYALRTGARFEMSRLVTGEAAVGYGRQTPKDKSFKPIEGLLVDGEIAWAPSALTTVRLSAKSALQETTLQNSAGVLSRNLGLSVEHFLRRNWSVTAKASFDRADYKGSARIDDAFTLGLETEYRLTRSLALTGSLEKLWLDSSIPNDDYDATIIEIGLRLRR